MAVDEVLKAIEKGKIKGGFGEIARRLRESEGFQYTRGKMAVELYGNKHYSFLIIQTETGQRPTSVSTLKKYLSYFSIPQKYYSKIIEDDAEWYGKMIVERAIAREKQIILRRKKKLQKLL